MPETKQKDINSIRQFLLSRGWQLSRSGDRFDRFSPPRALNLGQQFWVTLPKGSVGSKNEQRYISEVSKILATIYGWSPEGIDRVVQDTATVFSIRLADDAETRDGALPLVDFESFLSRLKDLIRDAADFATGNLPFAGSAIEASTAFLQSCLFLQTERGSFVTRIELPSNVTLRPGDLVQRAITGKDASDRLAAILGFVRERVILKDPTIYEDDIFISSSELLGVDVLSDIEGLIEHIGRRAITFQFSRSELDSTISLGQVTGTELSNLREYVKFIRDKLSQVVPINVVGEVVQLRSRDPDSDKNIVTVLDAERSFSLPIVLSLDSNNYSVALDAHREKRPVRVRGVAIRLKTQLKLIRVEEFGFLNS